MIVLGIDPGLAGGIAVVKGTRGAPALIAVIDIPTSGADAKRRVDPIAVIRFIQEHNPDFAVIERAQAMPDQGSSSGFSYGRAVGYLECCVLGMEIPLEIVEPRAWKKTHGLSGRGPDGTKLSSPEVKEQSRQKALLLFPGSSFFARKLDHGRAEAALIAEHGRRLRAGQ